MMTSSLPYQLLEMFELVILVVTNDSSIKIWRSSILYKLSLEHCFLNNRNWHTRGDWDAGVIYLSHTLFDQNSILQWWDWSDIFKVQDWAMAYGGSVLPKPYAPSPLHRHTYSPSYGQKPKELQGITFGAYMTAGVGGSLSVLTANHLWFFIQNFLSGFKIKVSLALDKLPSQADMLHLMMF